jgi:hypothetical protein
MSTEDKVSRRGWLAKAALVASTAGATSLLPYSSLAEEKAGKSTVQYQDRPKGMQMCGMCRFFISANGRRGGMMGGGMMNGGMMAAGSCEVVAGSISPMGYCILYAPSEG